MADVGFSQTVSVLEGDELQSQESSHSCSHPLARNYCRQIDSLPSEPPGKPMWLYNVFEKKLAIKGDVLNSKLIYMLCLVAQSCPILCNTWDCSPPGSSVHGGSPGKNTGVGCHVLLQGSFWLTDQTRISYISCTGTLVFYHWATKETLDVDCLHLSGECPTVYTVFPHNSIMFNLIFIVS